MPNPPKELKHLILRCSKCNTEKQSDCFYMDNTRGRRWECKDCMKIRIKNYFKFHPRKKILIFSEQWYKYRFYSLRKRAKLRHKEFNLTIEELKLILKREECFYCKDNFEDKKNYKTVDRFNNEIGYIYSNCLLCCWYCNRIKSNLSLKDTKNLKRLKAIADILTNKIA